MPLLSNLRTHWLTKHCRWNQYIKEKGPTLHVLKHEARNINVCMDMIRPVTIEVSNNIMAKTGVMNSCSHTICDAIMVWSIHHHTLALPHTSTIYLYPITESSTAESQGNVKQATRIVYNYNEKHWSANPWRISLHHVHAMEDLAEYSGWKKTPLFRH